MVLASGDTKLRSPFAHLRTISSFLACMQNLEDKAVISVAENCKCLQYLCLSQCNRLTDASLIVLAQQCHHLSTLEVAGCTHFTDAGFQALARVSSLDECVGMAGMVRYHVISGCHIAVP